MSNMSKIKKIAITGGIGSGKSTLKSILEEMDYPVFDADECVANLYKNDLELISHFKVLFFNVVDSDGVNKTKLRQFLLENPNYKQQVEELVHPKVLLAFNEFVNHATCKLVFGEIPLLFEVNWQDYFDEVWCVFASKELIIKRLSKNRALSEEMIQSMLNWQMDPQKKCAMSTFVLYNNKGIECLRNQVIDRLKQTESRITCIK